MNAEISKSKKFFEKQLITKDFLITDKKIMDAFNESLEPLITEFFRDGARLSSIYGQEMISLDGVDPSWYNTFTAKHLRQVSNRT